MNLRTNNKEKINEAWATSLKKKINKIDKTLVELTKEREKNQYQDET